MPEGPDAGSGTQRFEDPLAVFAGRLKAAGGQLVRMLPGEGLDEVVRRCCPGVRRIASDFPELLSATGNPDCADLCVVAGAFGVAENGAVWIRQDIRRREFCASAAALLVVLPKDAVVDTMHEAVLRPEVDDFGYGCFVSGAPQTSDPGPMPVFGIRGPIPLTVVMRP